ncbi:MAG: Rrf2 family transcriptional regulator [Lachnospiraceae bacterium]|nr:Rrf2 family transcriptional regulator [Lachnospiraceae bacterium]
MKISTKGRYALRMMLDLAKSKGEKPISIKEIAERQHISDKYLEQIISVLNKAGYVKSVRGPQGGYMLLKNPEDYTVGMILRLIEGNLAPVECLEFEENTCPRREECVTLKVWEKINDAVKDVVDNITLEDLIQWGNDMSDHYSI